MQGGLELRRDGLHLRCTPEVEAQTYSAVGTSVWAQFPAVSAATTVCVGANSHHLDHWDSKNSTVGFYRRLAREVGGGAKLVVMEGKGHFGCLDRGGVDEFVQIVLDAITVLPSRL